MFRKFSKILLHRDAFLIFNRKELLINLFWGEEKHFTDDLKPFDPKTQRLSGINGIVTHIKSKKSIRI